MIKILILIVVIFITGCNTQYDGHYCKTDTGKIIILKHNVGDTYFIREVNISKINKLNKFIKEEK